MCITSHNYDVTNQRVPNQAYHEIGTFTNDHVIEEEEVVQISSLLLICIVELDAYGFPNKDFRSQKLVISKTILTSVPK